MFLNLRFIVLQYRRNTKEKNNFSKFYVYIYLFFQLKKRVSAALDQIQIDIQ